MAPPCINQNLDPSPKYAHPGKMGPNPPESLSPLPNTVGPSRMSPDSGQPTTFTWAHLERHHAITPRQSPTQKPPPQAISGLHKPSTARDPEQLDCANSLVLLRCGAGLEQPKQTRKRSFGQLSENNQIGPFCADDSGPSSKRQKCEPAYRAPLPAPFVVATKSIAVSGTMLKLLGVPQNWPIYRISVSPTEYYYMHPSERRMFGRQQHLAVDAAGSVRAIRPLPKRNATATRKFSPPAAGQAPAGAAGGARISQSAMQRSIQFGGNLCSKLLTIGDAPYIVEPLMLGTVSEVLTRLPGNMRPYAKRMFCFGAAYLLELEWRTQRLTHCNFNIGSMLLAPGRAQVYLNNADAIKQVQTGGTLLPSDLNCIEYPSPEQLEQKPYEAHPGVWAIGASFFSLPNGGSSPLAQNPFEQVLFSDGTVDKDATENRRTHFAQWMATKTDERGHLDWQLVLRGTDDTSRLFKANFEDDEQITRAIVDHLLVSDSRKRAILTETRFIFFKLLRAQIVKVRETGRRMASMKWSLQDLSRCLALKRVRDQEVYGLAPTHS